MLPHAARAPRPTHAPAAAPAAAHTAGSVRCVPATMDATHTLHDHGLHHPRRRQYEAQAAARSLTHACPSAISRSRNRNQSDAPASPELISSLITSLSAISRPTSHQFGPPLDLLSIASPIASPITSPITSPIPPHDPHAVCRMGSFGVDYHAFSKPDPDPDPDFDHLHPHALHLDELAAIPPVVKTAKPPSGYSPLTAPKSPNAAGLRSFLAGPMTTSRPSSRRSATSKDADVQSLGNISVERGLNPASSPLQVRKQRSTDSWGKKASHKHSRLVNMSSKERLNADNCKGAALADHSNSLSASAMPWPIGARSDWFLGETPHPLAESSPGLDDHMSPQSIPQRDSSLRRTRSSARASRSSRRNSNNIAIPEEDPDDQVSQAPPNGESAMRRRVSSRDADSFGSAQHSRTGRSKDGLLEASWATASEANHYIDHYVTDAEVEVDDGAPAPSIAQGKRRDREVSKDQGGRRLSGRTTPELRPKRSISKMKRQSSATSQSKDDVEAPYERPSSADSIDDAVDAYMRSPRLSQKIRHPQTGRVISFSEVGDSEGSAVFCCVGMGLTRYITAFYDELALTLKLRLITPDRPGVGDSEGYADGTATPLGWPDDVYTICQALKITKFSMLAHSAGAIYALATALRMPQHIRGRIHLLAPWIPPSQMSVFGASAQAPLPPSNAIPTSQKLLRALPTPFLKAANSSFVTATSSSITSSLPKQKKAKRKPSCKDIRSNADGEIFNAAKNAPDMPTLTRRMDPTEGMDQIRPEGASSTAALIAMASMAAAGFGRNGNGGDCASDSMLGKEDVLTAAAESALADKQRQESYDMRLTHTIWQVATTGANPAVDLLVCLERRHTIGFRYVDITRPVVIHHGSRDTRVPVENVKWLGKTMRRCEVRVLEGEGHGLMASAPVMGTVLMEISKEWEDWNKATGQTRKGGR